MCFRLEFRLLKKLDFRFRKNENENLNNNMFEIKF